MSKPRPVVDLHVEAALGGALEVARQRFLDELRDPEFLVRCLKRYAEGQAEYRYAYEWLLWGEKQFDEEIDQEITDVVIYEAMRHVVRQNPGHPLHRMALYFDRQV